LNGVGVPILKNLVHKLKGFERRQNVSTKLELIGDVKLIEETLLLIVVRCSAGLFVMNLTTLEVNAPGTFTFYLCPGATSYSSARIACFIFLFSMTKLNVSGYLRQILYSAL
jgi:hypothetical protein